MEITLRTPAALEAVRAHHRRGDGHASSASAPCTKPLDITHAVDAGAEFPGQSRHAAELAQALADAPVPALPGCATVSEAMTLAALGFPVLKFFPAEASGGAALAQGRGRAVA